MNHPLCPICGEPVTEVVFGDALHDSSEWSGKLVQIVREAKDQAQPCGDWLDFDQYMSLWRQNA